MCGIFAYLSTQPLDVTSSTYHDIQKAGLRAQPRGPDATREQLLYQNRIHFTFHRLAIVDRSERGMQPFTYKDSTSICNGELYNHQALRDRYGMQLTSRSDSEVVLPLLEEVGPAQACNMLDGVFAFIAVNETDGTVTVGRDPFGVRALYKGVDIHGNVILASEVKCIPPDLFHITPFPPGTYSIFKQDSSGSLAWTESVQERYYSYQYHPLPTAICNEDTVIGNIRQLLEKGVDKRLMSDRPIGCLLSGGLDSSIIAALLAERIKKNNPENRLQTFSVGLPGSEDLRYARIVAEHIGSEHHEHLVSEEDLFRLIPEDIRVIESYDTTTIRASTPMYSLCKFIRETTDATVIFSGEGSDEASGSYLYFHNAPDEFQFQKECERLLGEMHRFDVLRCDKSSAGAGLEVRVPFLDKDFIHYYMSIPPSMKQPGTTSNGISIEKYLLRKAFEDLLPNSITWRVKDGMSDGISSIDRPWYMAIQERIPDDDFQEEVGHNPPPTPEARYYRNIFRKHYPNQDTLIPYYWLPKWSGETVEPSGRLVNLN